MTSEADAGWGRASVEVSAESTLVHSKPPSDHDKQMKSELQCDLAALRRRGIIQQKQPGYFTVRLRVVGGRFEAVELTALVGILTKYTLENVHLTTRQGIEIPNVRFEDIDKLCSDFASAGLGTAALGPCVRTITACQGGTCRHGLFDTQRLAQSIYEKVSGRTGLPHKFKIGITGCPNACIKPRENDLGIMGVVGKAFQEDLCNGCGLCVSNCPAALGVLRVEDGRLVLERGEDVVSRLKARFSHVPAGRVLSEELIVERREEARLEAEREAELENERGTDGGQG